LILLVTTTLVLEYYWPPKPWYPQAPLVLSTSDHLPLLAFSGLAFGVAGAINLNTWALASVLLYIVWFMLVPSHGFA
jgi:hypothetical protein